MRTLLLALVVAALPFGLYGQLVDAPMPGVGFPQASAGERWLHGALIAGAALAVYSAFLLRTGFHGPALAAAVALAAFPSMPDAVASPWGRGPLVFTCGASLAAAVLALAFRGREGRLLFGAEGLLGAACLVGSWSASTRYGADALGPRAPFAVPAAILAGETAAFLVRRREGSGAGAHGALVAGLAGALAVAVALGQIRAASWGDPVAFWDRAVHEDPGNVAALGASAGSRAVAGDLPGAAERLRSFVESCAAGRGAALRGDEARGAGAGGALLAASALLAAPGAGDRETPAAALRAAQALAPGSAAVRRVLGMARLGLGEFADAVRDLEEAVRIDPADAAAWDGLARARLRTGRTAEALEASTRATGLRPMEKAFIVTFAEALLAEGRGAPALRALHDALGPPPFDPVVAVAYADAHLRIAEEDVSAGAKGRALRRVLAGLEVDPSHAGCQELRDRLEREFAAERPIAEKWTEPGPGGTVDPDLWLRHAVWLARWGKYEESEAHFRRLLELRGSTAAIHFQFGYELCEQRATREGFEAAVDAYRDAIVREPDYVEPRNRLWQCLRTLGRIEEAREAARRFVEKARDHPDAVEAERFLAETGGGHVGK